MITAVTSSRELKNKCILDAGLQAHDLPQRSFNRWVTEAIQQIGGLTQSSLFTWCHAAGFFTDTNGYPLTMEIPTGAVKIIAVGWNELDPDEGGGPSLNPSDYYLAREDNSTMYFVADNTAPLCWYRTGYVESARSANTITVNRSSGNILAVVSGFRYESTSLYHDSLQPEDIGQTEFDGTVMIPVNAVYQEAIYWYIMMKLDYIQFRRNPGKRQSQLTYSQDMFARHRRAAYAEAMMPDEQQMEKLGNTLGLDVSYTGLRKNHPTAIRSVDSMDAIMVQDRDVADWTQYFKDIPPRPPKPITEKQ